MFGKRRRAASNPPQRAPPSVSASASLAATKAFIRDRESNGDLSSAAAAAALRTHTPTPTPVGDTITKRMVRRGSTSSNGSSARPGPGLRRLSSSGSMTERSFRAPSPGRATPTEFNPPPVPPVPQYIQKGSTAHRRASSLEPAYRGASPARGSGRGVSLDRGASNAARGQRPTSHLAQVSEEEDAAARSSVNFSRPMSPGATASKQNPSPPNSHGWFGGPVVNQEAVQSMASNSRPQTSSGVSSYDMRQAQRSVQNAAERPVKTHQISHGVQGARLSSGSMRARPSGTAVPSGPVDPKSPNAIYDPSTRTFIHKQAAMARFRQLHEEPELSQQYVEQHVEDYQPHRVASPPRHRSPSPVRQYVPREEPPAPQRVASPPRRQEVSAPTKEYSVQPEAAPRQQSSSMLRRPDSEDFADADFQQQEQANTGHKLETTSSTEPEFTENVDSPRLKSNQDSSYPYLATPSANVAAPKRDSANVKTTNDRNVSLSPPRSAHFAPVAVELVGPRHEPLPRSSSPAKSALKSSPSVSRRSHSPMAANGRPLSMSASSEASDATSNEGTRMKKRNMRVSFEETPVIAGAAASTHAEKATSPQGLNASRWSPIAEKDNEFEDFMKPRPALPSFGSIRERERRSMHEDMPEKVTEIVSSSTTPMSASVGSIADHTHISSDHAIGNIVAQDFARKSPATNDPLPPQVTTVEGSGYVSDSSDESGFKKHGEAAERWQQSPAPEPKSLSSQIDDKSGSPAAIVKRTIEVPGISLLPATPSPSEKPEPQFQSMTIPGGWGDETQGDDVVTGSASNAASKTSSGTSAPQSARQQEPATQSTAHEDDGDTTEDDSSVYSDAYEDLSDTEGGFASIDALMESPVATSRSGLLFSKYADDNVSAQGTPSKLKIETQVDDETDEETTPTQDWDATKQHWSGLNTARKESQQYDAPAQPVSHAKPVDSHASSTPATRERVPTSASKGASSQRQSTVEPVQRVTTPSQGTKPLKSALKKAPTPQPPPAVESQMRTSMRGPPANQNAGSEQTHMRKTMRAGTTSAPRAESGMRSSMRGGPEPAPRAQPQMRQSMRGAENRPSTATGLSASRHSMGPVDSKPPRGALQKRHIPAAAPRPQSMPAAKPVAPVPTYDSDSDASASSFQRTRARGSRNQDGRYTMRGSMRQEPAPTMRTTAPAPKQVRAISPPGSPAPALRKSMRPSSPRPETVKSSRFSIRSLSPMGRFRNKMPDVRPASPTPAPRQTSAPSKQAKTQKQKAPAAERAKGPFRSRFADSSDEEDDQPRRFQSRFADSDDDEPLDYKLPPDLTPVRGIPRRAGDDSDDSTDLEEEADEKPKILTASAANGVQNGKANGQGAILASGSLRDSKHAPAMPSFEAGGKAKTKRGFFGLGKKKAATVQPVAAEAPVAHNDIPLPPPQRVRDAGAALTPIDEDKDFGTPAASPATKKSPKLQRRATPEWPLPSPPVIGNEERPMSSDGIAPRRPRFAKRQSSQLSNVTAPVVDATGRSVSYGRSGKKKKFQGLRRVFGLND